MNKNPYENEVMNNLCKKQTKIVLNEENSEINEDSKFIMCGCPNHGNSPKLREGNKVFAIIIKKDSEWFVEDTTCWQCSVKDVVERITQKVPIAIVEGVLTRESEQKELAYYIDNPKVWEVITPSE